jgi:hypothetical protein
MHAYASPSSTAARSRLSPSYSITRLGTPMRRSPSANHLNGLRLLGKSSSCPALPWWAATLPALTPPRQVDGDGPGSPSSPPSSSSRPLTPYMQREMADIAFNKQPPASAAIAAARVARDRERRRAKYAPGPKLLRICRISCDDLPDADKGMGGGTSDPYLTFTLVTDRGDKFETKTKTIMNAPRDVAFPDVLELPLPLHLLRGKSNGTLIVRVWDDDSVADGLEGINTDDLMGQNAYKFNCRLFPFKLEGNVDRATFAGIGGLYAFRVSFRYEAVPEKPPAPSKIDRSLTGLNAPKWAADDLTDPLILPAVSG